MRGETSWPSTRRRSAPRSAVTRTPGGAHCGRLIGALAREASLADVESIAVDGTSGTILPVDTAGCPLAPASLYNVPADPADVARVARVAPPGSAARGASSPLARALAWRNLKGLAHLLHEADWLAGRLCGRFGVSDWNNALKTGYDPAIPGWPAWLGALGLGSGTPARSRAAGTAPSAGFPRRWHTSAPSGGGQDRCRHHGRMCGIPGNRSG